MKKLSVLMTLVCLCTSAMAEVFNPCNNLNEIVYGAFAPGYIGTHPTGGPDGSASIFWTTSAEGPHAITWNFPDSSAKSGGSLSFDIRHAQQQGAATLVGWLFYNDASSPSGESIWCPPVIDSVVLTPNAYQHIVIPMPPFDCTITRVVFIIQENEESVDIDNLRLQPIFVHPGDVDKGPFHNPCVSLDEFTYGAYNAGDIGIHPTTGPDGSASVFFVPRDAGPHSITWDFTDVVVSSGDAFEFDIKNMLILEPATLTLWIWMDDDNGGETIYSTPETTGVVLGTNDWQHFRVDLPSGKIRRITFIIEESGKVVDLDNLQLIPANELQTGLYEYGPIYNPCDSLTNLILPVYESGYPQEGKIVSTLSGGNGNQVRFVTRAENNNSLTWDIPNFDVTAQDFMTFDIMNEMVFGAASLVVNLSWQTSTDAGVWQAEVLGLTNDGLIDSAGWKSCRASMPPFNCTITNIVFVIQEDTRIVTMDNLAISPRFIPQSCDHVKQAGLRLEGDINGDCYVNMDDLKQVVMGWVHNTDPYSPDHVTGIHESSGQIVRGSAIVDGSIAEWSNQVEWINIDHVTYLNPSDVSAAKMALRWSDDDKIYAAIVVTDAAHYFEDAYISWDASDKIEVFSQGDAAGGTYSSGICDIAQQYFVWNKTLATGGFGASWALGRVLTGNPVPNFEYAASISGNDLIYEVGVKMYDNYAGRPGAEGATVVTNLAPGSVVGFDVVVDSKWGDDSSNFGVLAANTADAKSTNASAFAKYTLVEQATCGMLGYLNGDINKDCYVNFKDFSDLASRWMQCNDPAGSNCISNW